MSDFRSLANNLLPGYDKIIIVGDFNLPNISWADSTYTSVGSLSQNFCDVLDDYFMSQLCLVPTRESNILDLIIMNQHELVTSKDRFKKAESRFTHPWEALYEITRNVFGRSLRSTLVPEVFPTQSQGQIPPILGRDYMQTHLAVSPHCSTNISIQSTLTSRTNRRHLSLFRHLHYPVSHLLTCL